MEETQSKLNNKLTAIIFGIIFLAVIGMLSLTFFNKKPKVKSLSKVYPQNVATVWEALTKKNIYFSTKPEITKFVIYDSINPRWVEYYGRLDSINNETVRIDFHKNWNYNIINRKYEMVNGITIKLDSLSNGTKVTIYEKSIYQNIWARTYFGVLKPSIVLDYEFLKLDNCLSSLKKN